jgi:hypothetical protein
MYTPVLPGYRGERKNNMKKAVLTVCVYGDFAKKDIRIKLFPAGSTNSFTFQNVLIGAGYDAKLFTMNDTDIPDSLLTADVQ